MKIFPFSLFFPCIILVLFFFSCHIGRQDILFKVKKNELDKISKDTLMHNRYQVEPDYKIRKGDYISIYILNSDFNFMGSGNTNKGQGGSTTVGTGNQNANYTKSIYTYLVESDGQIRLPLLDLVKLEGLSIREACKLLEQKYAEFYKNIFISISIENRRVFVLGESKQGVYYLKNEHTTLAEMLSDLGGLNERGKSNNIRLIRGESENPTVFVIDLSTFSGVKNANLILKENDIVYIEPIKKITSDTVNEIAPIMSLLTTFLLIWGVFFKK